MPEMYSLIFFFLSDGQRLKMYVILCGQETNPVMCCWSVNWPEPYWEQPGRLLMIANVPLCNLAIPLLGSCARDTFILVYNTRLIVATYLGVVKDWKHLKCMSQVAGKRNISAIVWCHKKMTRLLVIWHGTISKTFYKGKVQGPE